MPTPTKGARLGGSAAHQKAMLANLATSLFEHGRITTTEAKARRLRPVAERLITKAKRGDIHARRQVASTIRDKGIVHALFTEIGPRYENRTGGYTRIVKIGPRKGDNAPMAVIELVTEAFSPKAPKAAPAAPAAEVVEAPAEVVETEVATVADVDGNADVAEPLEDGSAPEGFEIKGNKDSMKFHTPASQWYDQTVAEVWFRTEEAAEAAGFVKAG